MNTYVDFKLENNLSSELLNMDKTYDFVIKPLKNDPLETTVSIFFFLETEIFTTKIVNSKSLKKICRQLLSLSAPPNTSKISKRPGTLNRGNTVFIARFWLLISNIEELYSRLRGGGGRHRLHYKISLFRDTL